MSFVTAIGNDHGYQPDIQEQVDDIIATNRSAIRVLYHA